jgi:hypothetical protein
MFLSEYKAPEGNPIVYSRYGKPSYYSNEKNPGKNILGNFVTDVKYNTLIVNVRKMIKEQESKAGEEFRILKPMNDSSVKRGPP